MASEKRVSLYVAAALWVLTAMGGMLEWNTRGRRRDDLTGVVTLDAIVALALSITHRLHYSAPPLARRDPPSRWQRPELRRGIPPPSLTMRPRTGQRVRRS